MMKFEVEPRIKIVIYILSITIGVLFVFIFIKTNKTKYKTDEIVNNNTNFSGVVSLSIPARAALHVRLMDGRRYLLPWAENENYKKTDLNKFIRGNDSLVKKSFSDTLFVYRDGKKYYFVFRETIKLNK